MDRERTVARVDEPVDAEEGEVHLAIGADDPGRADEYACVVEAIAVSFEQAEDGRDTQPRAFALDGAHARAGDGLGERYGLVATLEAIPGQGAFGEGDE